MLHIKRARRPGKRSFEKRDSLRLVVNLRDCDALPVHECDVAYFYQAPIAERPWGYIGQLQNLSGCHGLEHHAAIRRR